MTSGNWGVGTRPAIRFEDEYLTFPYIRPKDELFSKLIKYVNSFIESKKERQSETTTTGHGLLDKINSLINETYGIQGYEFDLINYALEVSRYQFQESKQNLIVRKINNDKRSLALYVNVFLEKLGNIYQGEKIRVDVYSLNRFIAMNFVFTSEFGSPQINYLNESTETREEEIFSILSDKISISKISEDLYVQKDIKGFESDSFYVIKPNEYKCWHPAIAWYDIDEILTAIRTAELDRMKI